MDAAEDAFVEEMRPIQGVPNRVEEWLGDPICRLAYRLDLHVLRPPRRSSTTPRLRAFVPSNQDRQEAKRYFDIIPLLQSTVEQHLQQQQPSNSLGWSDKHTEQIESAVEFLAHYLFMPKPPSKRARGSCEPQMTTVQRALHVLDGDEHRFQQMFCGWTPREVRKLAHELLVHIPEMEDNISCEERVLNLLARLKQQAATWAYQASLFQRSASKLCTLFSTTVALLLTKFDFLYSAPALARIPSEFVDLSRQAYLAQFRQAQHDAQAVLPAEYHGVAALMDASVFQTARQQEASSAAAAVALDEDEEDDEEEEDGGGEAAAASASAGASTTPPPPPHAVYALFIVLANQLRVYAGFATGHHELYAASLHDALKSKSLTLLCNVIIAENEVCKPLKRVPAAPAAAAGAGANGAAPAAAVLGPTERALSEALRIPSVDYSATISHDMPLLKSAYKLKSLPTRPHAIIEVGLLLANCKLCLEAEDVVAQAAQPGGGMYLPSLRGYLRGEVGQSAPAERIDYHFEGEGGGGGGGRVPPPPPPPLPSSSV